MNSSLLKKINNFCDHEYSQNRKYAKKEIIKETGKIWKTP